MNWRIFTGCLALALTTVFAADNPARPPVVFRVTDPVLPNETVVLYGDALNNVTGVQVARLPASARSLEMPRRSENATVLQASQTCVKFVLPPSFKAGVFACRVITPAGITPPLLLNRPQVWWAQGETGTDVAPGARLRVFGKCLALPGAKQAQLSLTGPRMLKLSARGDEWALTADLPKDLPMGQYELRVHADTGGDAGWSAAITFSVAVPAVWPDRQFNVREFAASGTGAADDTRAIQAALAAAAANGGGVVFFPRGRYRVSQTLTIPCFTVLRGERREWVNLCWPDSETPLPALLRGTNSFRVEELSLLASHYVHGIVGDLGAKPEAGNIRLHRVLTRFDRYRGHLTAPEAHRRFAALPDSGQGDTVQMGGANLEITDCDLYGSGRSLYLSQTRGVRIAGSTLYNGRLGWYCITGSDGLILEDNSIIGADLMSTGGGLNTFQGAYSQNVYYARNTLKLMHGWDREAMTSDTGGGAYYGQATVTGPITLRLEKPGRWGGRAWRGAAVIIVAGRGHGQYRQLLSQTEQDVTLDRPWDVPPDAGSLFSITMRQEHYLFCENDFSDAGIGIQFYGTSLEHIVTGNKARRAGGFQNIGKLYGGNYAKPPEDNYGHQPSWFCQFLDNEIQEGNIYRSGANNAIEAGESVIGIFGWPPRAGWPWPYNVGTVARRNTLHNNAMIRVGGSNDVLPSVQDAVIEANEIRATDVGIEVNRAARGVLLRGNRFTAVRTPFAGEGLAACTITPDQQLAGLRGRIQALAADCGVRDDLTQDPAVARLLTAAAASRETAVATAAVQALAGKTATAPWAAVSPLLGLRLETDAGTLPALLQSGAGGEATLQLVVTPSRPLPWSIQAEPVPPVAWTATASPTAELAAAVRLPIKLVLPQGAWGRQMLKVKLFLTHDPTRLCLTTAIPLGSGQLLEWQVIGPFPNKEKAVLVSTVFPPEQRVDLKAELSGPTGPLRWQPAAVGGDWLNLRSLWKTPKEGVGYALACVETAEETKALLRLRCSGGAALFVNHTPVWSGGADRPAATADNLVPVSLRKGENLLLLKLCTIRDEWRFAAELLSAAAQTLTGLRIVPATAFGERAVFALPAPPPPAAGPVPGQLLQPAGVAWSLRMADHFDRKELGDRWRVGAGNWQIADGQLIGSGNRAFIACSDRVSVPFRIEYEARIAGAAGADISAFWLRDPADYASGILAGFGSNGNSCNKVLENGDQVTTAAGPLVTPNKWHHVIVQVLPNGELQLFVDGQRSLAHRLQTPGPAAFPGVWTWDATAGFRNVRVYTAAAK